MLLFKFPKLYKRLCSSSSSVADSEAGYLNNHIASFLSNNILESRTLLSTHAYIITTGHVQNNFIAAKLIASYASLNQPHSSTKVFDSLDLKDLFLWNSIIKAHFSNGNYVETIEFFSKMWFCGNLPNIFTLPMVVSACAELGLLFIGMNVHGLVSKVNLFNGNSAVGASFVYMYSKCGVVKDASQVFDEIAAKDVVAWTALVIGYVQNGQSEKGLRCLCEMHGTCGNGALPNFRTLEGGFQACGDLKALTEGRCLHGLALKSGIVSSHVVQSAILSMYSKCGCVVDAQVSFCEVVNKDLFSWTSIIGVYARLGRVYDCFQTFLRLQSNGIYPDGMVISCLISSFANSMRVYEGKAFHGFILRRNYEDAQFVCSSLLSMYCKFGLLAVAEKIFIGGHNQEKDCWNLMIVGYEKAGLEINCINLFRKMQHQGIELDLNSLISVISSCSRLGAIHFGRSIHCHIVRNLMNDEASVANSLINMYGKCGSLSIAERIFHQTTQDVATWNSLVSCYANSGNSFKALYLFDKMISKGLKPNTATLVTLLSACAHIASLEKGRKIHNYIRETGFANEVSLATALVDMYAKCGEIDMAKEIFDSMNDKDVISWNVMISCYGMHGHWKSAIELFQQMEENDSTKPNDLTFLAILSACAHAGLIDEAKSFFDKMKDYSLTPSLKHYACLVDLYGRSGCLDEAEALILSMPFVPDGGIWGSLLTACKMHNNALIGIRIAKHAIEADPENDGYYILISDFYGSMEMWEEVEQLRIMMKDRGVRKIAGWSAV